MEKREIKFKVWLPEIQKMTYGLSITQWANGYEQITIGDKAVWLQFTGLKDKNGKEIYEGDIIAWDYEYDADYDGDMPIVKRSTGKAEVKDIFDRTRIKMAADESKGCEVIGNIYENPELLNEQNR